MLYENTYEPLLGCAFDSNTPLSMVISLKPLPLVCDIVAELGVIAALFL